MAATAATNAIPNPPIQNHQRLKRCLYKNQPPIQIIENHTFLLDDKTPYTAIPVRLTAPTDQGDRASPNRAVRSANRSRRSSHKFQDQGESGEEQPVFR